MQTAPLLSQAILVSPQAVSAALHRIDPEWTLFGSEALSRRARLLCVENDEGSEQCVLLTHSEADRARNAGIARVEFKLLETLHAMDLPVARPLALAEDHEPPFLITSYLSGLPRFDAENVSQFCQQLASALSKIHAVDINKRKLSFLPRLADVAADDIGRSGRGDERIRAALRASFGAIKRNDSVLLHGDFWPGNLLWEGDRLSGILDWEDAMLGDPMADLGKSRLELLWALGNEAVELYTAHYLSLNSALDRSALPFWDLWGAARLSHFAAFAADAASAEKMRAQYNGFVDAALDALQK